MLFTKKGILLDNHFWIEPKLYFLIKLECALNFISRLKVLAHLHNVEVTQYSL